MKEFLLGRMVSRIVLPIIALVAIICAVYFYNQVNILKQDPKVADQKEVSDLVAQVGKLLVLPTGEIPTLATVADPEALKDQIFFAKAQKGDKVLIYTQAKKAILYSVLLNKIIDVAPLNIGAQQAVNPPASKTSATKKP